MSLRCAVSSRRPISFTCPVDRCEQTGSRRNAPRALARSRSKQASTAIVLSTGEISVIGLTPRDLERLIERAATSADFDVAKLEIERIDTHLRLMEIEKA